MIQLLRDNGDLIYELEKSELFPDYPSVLKEAIALSIDLTGLLVISENLDNVIWKNQNLQSLHFKKCSLKKSVFDACYAGHLYFEDCDVTGLKVKKSTCNHLSFSACTAESASFRNSDISALDVWESNCCHATFSNCKIDHFSFHTSNLSDALFQNCDIAGSNFLHTLPNKDWLCNTFFINCSLRKCDMKCVDDISTLYFWETNVSDIQFPVEHRFTKVITMHNQVIYAIDADVVWWQPHSWIDCEKRLFRGTLAQFREEIKEDFPTTDLYPNMMDFETAEELSMVVVYLEQWANECTQ